MNVSARALEQFVVLAEELHFGRAAARLSMTQPPLSQAIQRLERVVGAPLLDRNSRTVTLSPAGIAFADDARHLLASQEAAVARARRAASGVAGDLHLGFVAGFASGLLPDLLGRWYAALPGMRVHLHQAPSRRLVESVRSGGLDLALARLPLPDIEDLTLVELASERLALAVGTGSTLADRGSVALAELAGERFALPSAPALAGLADMAVTACQGAGFAPVDAARSDSLIGLLAHVAASDCVSLVPESVITQSPPGVVVIEIEDPLAALTPCAVHRTGRPDPLLARCLNLIEHHDISPGAGAPG